MNLGAFSISLAVKDIEISRDFYAKLGFEPFAGEIEQHWLILRNGEHIIGLFQDMFEKNVITFNPGWNQNAAPLESFIDVREIQQRLKSSGIEILDQTDESGSGPASFAVMDPDGNPILIDQHVG